MDSTVSTAIVVDLDGTLTPADTLAESLVQLVKHSPLSLLRLPLWLLGGRAGFKRSVATRAAVSVRSLPYREPLLIYLRKARESGRRIILATAAHRSIAEEVSTHLGLFDEVIATESGANLKGEAKLAAIRTRVGNDFVYAGDSPADIPIWKAARAAVLVGVSPRLAERIRREVPVELEIPRVQADWRLWLRALRVHQWLKNLLLFVPLLTAFSFLDFDKLGIMMLAFFAFSLAASATYVVNDLLDLDSDRAHPRKRLRPFASAQLPVAHGLAVAALSLTVALVLATQISRGFLLMVLLYLVVTCAYSWMLKRYVLVDVLVLSSLYTLRILAGSVVLDIVTSSWLLAFSQFLFLSLALVKRCAELVALEKIGSAASRGRDYRVADLAVLWPFGVGAALSAVVVFGLFISADDTQARYATPELLWLVALCLIYWIARLWVKTSRGEMDDDPVVYAIRNRGSRVTILAMVVVTLAAHYFRFRALL